jgi:hypothetical protein
MHTDIYFYVKCNMGPEANVLRFVSFSSWLFWNVGSFLVPYHQLNMSLFHVRAIVTCDQPGSADAWITFSQKVLCLVCAEWDWSALSSMATRRSLTDWDITDLTLEYSDVHSSEDKRHFCSAWQWHYWHKTSLSGLTIQTCWPTLIVVHKFTEGPSGLQQTEASHINKTLPHSVFSCCSVSKLYTCWWKRQIVIITSTWTHRTKDSPHCLALLFRICVCFWQLLCRLGMIRGTCWTITNRH